MLILEDCFICMGGSEDIFLCSAYTEVFTNPDNPKKTPEIIPKLSNSSSGYPSPRQVSLNAVGIMINNCEKGFKYNTFIVTRNDCLN